MAKTRSEIESLFMGCVNRIAQEKSTAISAIDVKDAVYKQSGHFLESGYASQIMQGLYNRGLLRRYKTSHVKSTALYWARNHDRVN